MKLAQSIKDVDSWLVEQLDEKLLLSDRNNEFYGEDDFFNTMEEEDLISNNLFSKEDHLQSVDAVSDAECKVSVDA